MAENTKFGVVKPADKSEKSEPKKKRAKKDGINKPFEGQLAQLRDKERKEKDAKKLVALQKREAEKQKEKEAAEAAKHAAINRYAEDVQKRHPWLPSSFLEEIKACEKRGAAKRLLRIFLQQKAASSTKALGLKRKTKQRKWTSFSN